MEGSQVGWVCPKRGMDTDRDERDWMELSMAKASEFVIHIALDSVSPLCMAIQVDVGLMDRSQESQEQR